MLDYLTTAGPFASLSDAGVVLFAYVGMAATLAVALYLPFKLGRYMRRRQDTRTIRRVVTAGVMNYSGRKLGAAGTLDTFGVIPNGYSRLEDFGLVHPAWGEK